ENDVRPRGHRASDEVVWRHLRVAGEEFGRDVRRRPLVAAGDLRPGEAERAVVGGHQREQEVGGAPDRLLQGERAAERLEELQREPMLLRREVDGPRHAVALTRIQGGSSSGTVAGPRRGGRRGGAPARGALAGGGVRKAYTTKVVLRFLPAGGWGAGVCVRPAFLLSGRVQSDLRRLLFRARQA